MTKRTGFRIGSFIEMYMVRVFDKSCVVVGEVEVPLVSPDERWHWDASKPSTRSLPDRHVFRC